ncbi:MAG TPA: anti-sigma factor [Rubrobacter sp.]|nr:anti-sigma factor [Rubrobacter sp.]
MECDGRIKDLFPDYHLGQLQPEEAEEVRRHLAEHASCREALEEVAEVLDLMPFAVPASAPPPSLKARVLARASEPETTESEAPEPEDPKPDNAPQPVVPARTGGGRWRIFLPAAAGAILVFLTVFAWAAYLGSERENVRLQAENQRLERQSGSGLVVVGVEGTGRAPEARGTAVLDPADGTVALDVYNLPATPEGHSYRSWLVAPGGEAYSLGTMKTDDRGDGRMAGRLPKDPTPYETVQVTTEPIGARERAGPVYLESGL